MSCTGLEAFLIAYLEFSAGMRSLFIDAAGSFRAHGALEMNAPWRLTLGAEKTDTPRGDLDKL